MSKTIHATYLCKITHVLVHQKHISIPAIGIYLYSTGTHHRNLLKSLVTMSRVTYFILQACTGNCVSYSTAKKEGEYLEKNEAEWKGKA